MKINVWSRRYKKMHSGALLVIILATSRIWATGVPEALRGV